MLDIGELGHVVIHSDPEHPKHAQWVTCLSRQAMEELGNVPLPGIVYRSLVMGLCMIMLKHQVMAANEWHNKEPQDLVTVSPCIQIAIDKMQLCSLSVVCLQSACQLHAPSKHGRSVALCCVTKRHILEWSFVVPSTRCTRVMIMLFNQLLDMPYLSGGWINLAMKKCSLTRT